jgi:hypothetical protein
LSSESLVKDPSIFPLVSERRLAGVLGFRVATLRDVAERVDEFYRPFKLITKGKDRPIDNPVGLLKAIQGRIKDRLLGLVDFPPELVGGVKGRSIRTGALRHVQRPEVVTLDIRKFFRKIRPTQVANGWRSQLGTSLSVTWLLTRLTTYQGYLPQGAPTSTALANLVFLPIATELRALCVPGGLAFTVYVDDIAVSGPFARETIDESIRILSRHGFGASRKKTRIMPSSMRQQVTGLVVNRKVSNGRAKLRRLRRQLHDLEGAENVDLASIRGAVAQAAAGCPSQGRALQSLLSDLTNAGGA